MGKEVKYTVTIIEEDRIQNIVLNKFKKQRILIGRSTNNDIVLNSLLVSPYHGFFELVDNKVRIVDNNSVNGLFVNNTKVIETYLQDGDAIKIDNPANPLAMGVIMILTLGENLDEWQQYDLNSVEVTKIGRDPKSNIVLNHVSVPLNIANIYKKDDKYVLAPADTSNNILINGNLLGGAITLKDRDVILIADAKLIYVHDRILYQMYDKGVGVDAVDIVKTVSVK